MQHSSATPSPMVDAASAVWARTLVTSRVTVSAKRLVAPGPSSVQLQQLFEMAAAAPDHGQLVPWRFVIVPKEERHRLADVFALSLLDRDSDADVESIALARSKAHRAPTLIVAVARLSPTPQHVSAVERVFSLGAAVQNILLGAHAMGFGAGLTSGNAMASKRMAILLDLEEDESAVCCINIGTISQAKDRYRARPAPIAFVSELRRTVHA